MLMAMTLERQEPHPKPLSVHPSEELSVQPPRQEPNFELELQPVPALNSCIHPTLRSPTKPNLLRKPRFSRAYAVSVPRALN